MQQVAGQEGQDNCGMFFQSLGMIPVLIEVRHRLSKGDLHYLGTWPLFDLALP